MHTWLTLGSESDEEDCKKMAKVADVDSHTPKSCTEFNSSQAVALQKTTNTTKYLIPALFPMSFIQPQATTLTVLPKMQLLDVQLHCKSKEENSLNLQKCSRGTPEVEHRNA